MAAGANEFRKEKREKAGVRSNVQNGHTWSGPAQHGLLKFIFIDIRLDEEHLLGKTQGEIHRETVRPKQSIMCFYFLMQQMAKWTSPFWDNSSYQLHASVPRHERSIS